MNRDAVLLISKATELFIESLVHSYAAQNKKTIVRNDAMSAVDAVECWCFSRVPWKTNNARMTS